MVGDQANFTLQTLKNYQNICSGDETDLKNFLNDNNYISNEEKEFLAKYVISGISDSLRARVSNCGLINSFGW